MSLQVGTANNVSPVVGDKYLPLPHNYSLPCPLSSRRTRPGNYNVTFRQEQATIPKPIVLA